MTPVAVWLIAQVIVAPPQRPNRSTQPTQVGTIRGRVTGPTGRPLPRASVFVDRAGTHAVLRNATTDRDGRYEIPDVPAGSVTVVVSRPGYLESSYGQRRFHEPGTVLTVHDKDVIDDINVALPPMGRITGHVTDEFGQPLEGVKVVLMRPGYFEGRHQLVSGDVTASTNELGQYELNDVTPGSYYVLATLKDTWRIVEEGRERYVAYSTTYYPGTPSPSDARRVTLETGVQASNIDISMLPGHAARVSGTAVSSQGKPLDGDTIYITQEFRSAESLARFEYGGFAEVGPDGTWTIKAMPPGDYKIRMHTNLDTPQGNVTEDAAVPLTVSGADIEGVALRTTYGWSASGTVTADGVAPPPFPAAQAQLEPEILNGDTDPRAGGDNNRGTVNQDWTFTLTRVHGPARLKFTLPDGWTVKSIARDGKDLTGVPLEGKSAETLDNITVVITNHVTRLAATIADDKGQALVDATAVVFPVDQETWKDAARYLRLGHPDRQGQIHLTGLPPGEYYVAAVPYADPDNWQDPEFLQQLRERAQRVVLVEDQTSTVALKMQ